MWRGGRRHISDALRRVLSSCELLWFGTSWFCPYPSGLLHWHWGNLMIAPVPVKQPWRIWVIQHVNPPSCDAVTTTKHSTTNGCAYFMGYMYGIALMAVANVSGLYSPVNPPPGGYILRLPQCLLHPHLPLSNPADCQGPWGLVQ